MHFLTRRIHAELDLLFLSIQIWLSWHQTLLQIHLNHQVKLLKQLRSQTHIDWSLV